MTSEQARGSCWRCVRERTSAYVYSLRLGVVMSTVCLWKSIILVSSHPYSYSLFSGGADHLPSKTDKDCRVKGEDFEEGQVSLGWSQPPTVQRLPSGHRYIWPRCWTNRLENSFVRAAIGLLNVLLNMLWYDLMIMFSLYLLLFFFSFCVLVIIAGL